MTDQMRDKAIKAMLGLARGEEVEIITPKDRDVFRGIGYKSLIRPLVYIDRDAGRSYQSIANKWGVTIKTVRWILNES